MKDAFILLLSLFWTLSLARAPPMAALLLHALSFIALFSYGLHHLAAACRARLRTPHRCDYAAQPHHPLPLPSSAPKFLRHLPLLLLLLFLLLSSLHQALLSPSSPLLRFHSLQSAFSLLLFLPLLLPLPSDLSFLLAALAFSLRSLRYSSLDPPDDLPALCESTSSTLAAISSLLCLSLAAFPNLFAAEVALASSISLQGLWILQTGLSLYAEAFIPEGCHQMLEGSTRCELQESRLRAAALLDLALTVHAAIAAVMAVVVYLAVARVSGFGRNLGSYEALSVGSSSGGIGDVDHVQMKAVGKSTMQA